METAVVPGHDCPFVLNTHTGPISRAAGAVQAAATQGRAGVRGLRRQCNSQEGAPACSHSCPHRPCQACTSHEPTNPAAASHALILSTESGNHSCSALLLAEPSMWPGDCRYCSGSIAPAQLCFESSPNGKPWLVSAEACDAQTGRLHFNLTHTEALLGLSTITLSPFSARRHLGMAELCCSIQTTLELAETLE